MPKHFWTEEQRAWLRAKYPTMTPAMLADEFGQAFGCTVTPKQVRSALRNHKIRQTERSGRFVKGQVSWNKGVKGYMGANATSFRKGNMPHNHQPLWSERVDKNNYIEMSVPERNPYTGFPTKYKHKHLWLWEQEHGPKPAGHAVTFADGDNRNFSSENLVLVTRAELLAMNLHGYKGAPAELKPSIMALSKVEVAAKIRLRPARGRKAKG